VLVIIWGLNLCCGQVFGYWLVQRDFQSMNCSRLGLADGFSYVTLICKQKIYDYIRQIGIKNSSLLVMSTQKQAYLLDISILHLF
jgi:hypothetical protein